MIDLRSDTVTKPTSEMLHAAVLANVGDDVFGEDETVNQFQVKMAALFGFEAGLFVPSGTMSNQLGIHLLTEVGDEVLIHETGHLFNYEATAGAWLSSIQFKPLSGSFGKLRLKEVQSAIRTRNEWDPFTKVLALEYSTNKGGGACYTESELRELSTFARSKGLYVHLDGARVWNALTATGMNSRVLGDVSDTLSICFSKGLGAPIGSMLLSTSERIGKARRIRKMLGGGMRQVGVLAAMAEYAVEHHWDLLKDDHRRAKELGGVLSSHPKFRIDSESIETNILIVETVDSAAQVVDYFKNQQVLIVPFGTHKIRITYHFQITEEAHEEVLRQFKAYT